jgi:hypothetical protein
VQAVNLFSYKLLLKLLYLSLWLEFDTSRLEMNAVADLFDRSGEGLIDWKEFIAALRADWEEQKPMTEAEKNHDEMTRLLMRCACHQKFRVYQVGEGKYRVSKTKVVYSGNELRLHLHWLYRSMQDLVFL